MIHDALKLGARVDVLPVVHGAGDCAVLVRRVMLEYNYDCLAVPLPPSFQHDVEAALDRLPAVTVVVQREERSGWQPDFSEGDDTDEAAAGTYAGTASFVPIDPCQPVIAALRVAEQERIPTAFIDRETAVYEPLEAVFPDPYALKRVTAGSFAAAVIPHLPPLPEGQPRLRATHMGRRLYGLSRRFRRILFVVGLWEWPYVREAFLEAQAEAEGAIPDSAASPDGVSSANGDGPPAKERPRGVKRSLKKSPASNEPDPADAEEAVEETTAYRVESETLFFVLGELPYITGRYEACRAELDDDTNLSIDGVKDLLLETRARYRSEHKKRARDITPHLLTVYLRYVRNLALMERRFTPDLYSLAVAAQQIAGDQFAINLVETCRDYPYPASVALPELRAGIGEARLPDGDLITWKNRLQGQPVAWRTLHLRPKPKRSDKTQWEQRWNPYGQCSYPPEDVAIEKFRTSVTDRALAILGNDLARTEKFTTSLRDGLDIRETLRNWHTGDLYVKVLPPTRGHLDCVIMLFDSPADPRDYPWRSTWMAEHDEESTISFFATDYRQELVGPGIAMATYGGVMFLFPPRPLPEVWTDSRFDFTTTVEERLIASGCYYAEQRHIVLLSYAGPGAAYRAIARRFGKKIVHVPLNHFSQSQIQQLRMMHVLNGKHIRSYAADFIRRV